VPVQHCVLPASRVCLTGHYGEAGTATALELLSCMPALWVMVALVCIGTALSQPPCDSRLPGFACCCSLTACRLLSLLLVMQWQQQPSCAGQHS
jgi:hypothetical protein